MLKKVLVVDDSELIHNMYRIMLRKYAGCCMTSAMNGREALDVFERETDFDLVLLDINMPIMNGLEFLRKFRKKKESVQIPVIVISTEGKEEDTLRAIKIGASGYIVKPFQSSRLHELIEKIFEKKTAQAI